VTDSITTAVRLYKEAFAEIPAYNMDRVPVIKPTGCARFKNEMAHQPDFVVKDKFVNLIHSTAYDDGGHFAAMQLPKVMYEDIIEFTRKTLKM
jgi:juvenile hormone epoxide hydrolase